MNAFIFVGIVCVGQACTFLASTEQLTEKQCLAFKQNFLETKFDKQITLAATQCMPFKSGEKI